jgi:hypothetical protein
MKKLLLSLLCLLPLSASATDIRAGGSRVPVAAQQAGYLTNTYSVSSFSEAIVDQAQAYAPGYKLYYWNTYGNADPAMAVGTIFNSDGSMSVKDNSAATVLRSAGRTTAPPNYIVGKAFGGGGYFEAELKLDYTIIASTNQPAFWLMTVEHLSNDYNSHWPGQAAAYQHYLEVDILERRNDVGEVYMGNMHDWYGDYYNPVPASCGTYCNHQPSYSEYTIKVEKAVDWTLYHRYAVNWIPATDTTDGRYDYYFDDVLKRTTTFSKFDPNSVPPASPNDVWPQAYGIGDYQHQTIIFGGVTVKSVNVWQKDDTHNITQ